MTKRSGNVIWMLRREMGLTQIKFARRLKLSQPYVCQLEQREDWNFEVATLQRVAKALKMKLRVSFEVTPKRSVILK